MANTFFNSQGEQISIEDRMLNGAPVRCLVIYDDPPPRGTGRPAPMLLDDGTRRWLMEQLTSIATPDTKGLK